MFSRIQVQLGTGVPFLSLHPPWDALFALRSGWKQGRTPNSRASTRLHTNYCIYLDLHWSEKTLICWLLLCRLYIFLAEVLRGLSLTVCFSTGDVGTCWLCAAISKDEYLWNMSTRFPSHHANGTKQYNRDLQISAIFALIFMFSIFYQENNTEGVSLCTSLTGKSSVLTCQ